MLLQKGRIRFLSRFRTAISLLHNRKQFNKALANRIQYSKLSRLIPDKQYVSLIYWLSIGRKLNLRCPRSYNEKMQWIKLYDRRNEYIKYVDKLAVRDFISSKIGEEHLIPILGHWTDFELIDFKSFPEQFVLKCNHDSGSVVICRNKKNFDVQYAKNKLTRALSRNMYYFGREWPYKEVKPCIIAEKYLTDNDNSECLTDYKIYCFNGQPRLIMMASDRFTEKKFDYLDVEFNWLDLEWGAPRSLKKPQKPECFDEMIRLARKISEGLPEVRVDFYASNGNVYFGEMTFFDGSGFEEIIPYDWDLKIGSWIHLRSKPSNDNR